MHKRLSFALVAALLLTPALAQSSTTSTGTSATSTTGSTTPATSGTNSAASGTTNRSSSGTTTRGTGSMSMNMMSVNVNTATLAQLQRIPGMNAKLAQAVITARAKGPFKNEADFVKRVKGIGTHNVKKFQQYLKFS